MKRAYNIFPAKTMNIKPFCEFHTIPRCYAPGLFNFTIFKRNQTIFAKNFMMLFAYR